MLSGDIGLKKKQCVAICDNGTTVHTWSCPPINTLYKVAPPTHQNMFSLFQQLLPSSNSQTKAQYYEEPSHSHYCSPSVEFTSRPSKL